MSPTDSPHLVRPGKSVSIAKLPTSDRGDFKDKESALAAAAENLAAIDTLQERLYASRSHALLIVLQAMDAGGKDGTIKFVFDGINPQGCYVANFKAPSSLELAHDYLWRIHAAVPPRGMIGIFNRSHYESVLVERVKSLAPEKVWSKRYDQISAFEEMLASENVVVLKFFLHISKDEQRERFQSRIDDPAKHWKFNPADLAERAHWDEYQTAYEDLLNRTSTKHAPWYAIPGDRKWYRNWAISDVIRRTMERMDLKFPDGQFDPTTVKID